MKTRHAGTCSRLPRGQYGCQSARPSARPSACCAPPLTPPLGLWALCSVGLETVQKKKGIILTNTMRAETAGRNPGIRGRGRYTTSEERIRWCPAAVPFGRGAVPVRAVYCTRTTERRRHAKTAR
jgi:hypothetical protein